MSAEGEEKWVASFVNISSAVEALWLQLLPPIVLNVRSQVYPARRIEWHGSTQRFPVGSRRLPCYILQAFGVLPTVAKNENNLLMYTHATRKPSTNAVVQAKQTANTALESPRAAKLDCGVIIQPSPSSYRAARRSDQQTTLLRAGSNYTRSDQTPK